MASHIGELVHYTPHPEHPHHARPVYPAIVTGVHPDGSADLAVIVHNQATPDYFDAVPYGDGPFTHRAIG